MAREILFPNFCPNPSLNLIVNFRDLFSSFLVQSIAFEEIPRSPVHVMQFAVPSMIPINHWLLIPSPYFMPCRIRFLHLLLNSQVFLLLLFACSRFFQDKTASQVIIFLLVVIICLWKSVISSEAFRVIIYTFLAVVLMFIHLTFFWQWLRRWRRGIMGFLGCDVLWWGSWQAMDLWKSRCCQFAESRFDCARHWRAMPFTIAHKGFYSCKTLINYEYACAWELNTSIWYLISYLICSVFLRFGF